MGEHRAWWVGLMMHRDRFFLVPTVMVTMSGWNERDGFAVPGWRVGLLFTVFELSLGRNRSV